MDPVSVQLARDVAGLAARLLDVHAEPAEVGTADAVDAAIERVAEGLLRWHDALCGLHPAAPSAVGTRTAPAAHASRELATAVHAGSLPGSAPETEVAGRELLHAARRTRAICGRVPAGALSATGHLLARDLDGLGGALVVHATSMREQERRLARHATLGAGGGALDPGQVLSAVMRAECRLHAAALATLRA